MDLIAAAEELMAEQMNGYDCSHDMLHILRVRRLTEKIAAEAPAPENVDVMVATLGAIFHDLIDHKYAAKAGVSIDSRLQQVESLLKGYGLEEKRVANVLKIINSVGYTKEKKLRATKQWTDWHEHCIEFHCVQDADRLDAMGAIGMMRCAAYSCAIDRPLFDPDPTSPAAYDHIEEKLLHLCDTLRTPTGKALGKQRHAFLLAFKQQMDLEDALFS